MSGKDDPTISCTQLMVKLSVLAGRKIILKWGGNHPLRLTRVKSVRLRSLKVSGALWAMRKWSIGVNIRDLQLLCIVFCDWVDLTHIGPLSKMHYRMCANNLSWFVRGGVYVPSNTDRWLLKQISCNSWFFFFFFLVFFCQTSSLVLQSYQEARWMHLYQIDDLLRIIFQTSEVHGRSTGNSSRG